MKKFKIQMIEKRTIEVEVVASSLEEAIAIGREGELDLSSYKEVDGSNEIYFYEAIETNDKIFPNATPWHEKILHDALKFDFIKQNQIEDAICIIQKYQDDLTLLENETTEGSIGLQLALASQI